MSLTRMSGLNKVLVTLALLILPIYLYPCLFPADKPLSSYKTFEAFLEHCPWTTRFDRFTLAGEHFVVAKGPRWSQLANGPSAYVFDGEGMMIDFTRDCRDDPPFEAKWYSGSIRQDITWEDALHILGMMDGPRDLQVALQGDPEGIEALRAALPPDGIVRLPRPFRISVIEPDPSEVYRIIDVKADPEGGYEIGVLDPRTKDPDAEFGDAMAEALEDLLR